MLQVGPALLTNKSESHAASTAVNYFRYTYPLHYMVVLYVPDHGSSSNAVYTYTIISQNSDNNRKCLETLFHRIYLNGEMKNVMPFEE